MGHQRSARLLVQNDSMIDGVANPIHSSANTQVTSTAIQQQGFFYIVFKVSMFLVGVDFIMPVGLKLIQFLDEDV